MSLIRSMRGGKDYDATWGKRMTGSGPYAWMIGQRFRLAAERLGLNNEASRSPQLFASRRKPGSS